MVLLACVGLLGLFVLCVAFCCGFVVLLSGVCLIFVVVQMLWFYGSGVGCCWLCWLGCEFGCYYLRLDGAGCVFALRFGFVFGSDSWTGYGWLVFGGALFVFVVFIWFVFLLFWCCYGDFGLCLYVCSCGAGFNMVFLPLHLCMVVLGCCCLMVCGLVNFVCWLWFQDLVLVGLLFPVLFFCFVCYCLRLFELLI